MVVGNFKCFLRVEDLVNKLGDEVKCDIILMLDF